MLFNFIEKMNRIFFLTLFFLSCTNTDCGDLIFNNGTTTLKGKLFSGNCVEYYPNGQLKSVQNYLDGKDHGDWIFYFSAEIPRTKGSFNRGIRIGKWEYYYQNGNPWKINYYDSLGNKTGKWITYNIDKSIDSIVTFN
jgi:antitoxin component YwqK of YwqJK toxin-antitoxin module